MCILAFYPAISDYRQSLQFRHLNEEKQNIQVEVGIVTLYDHFCG
jgi:hypothetical protein